MRTRDFLPPIIINLLRKHRIRGTRLYSSYEEALNSCDGGYEAERLVKVIYEKTKIYHDLIATQSPLIIDMIPLGVPLRTVLGLSLALSGKELNVIDFGGACGSHYYIAKALFGERIAMKWHVVETPRMSKAAKNLEDGQIKFFDNLDEAKSELNRIDLVFSSGAIPYVPEPYEILRKLTECGAKNIFVTRTPLTTGDKELIIIQTSTLSINGPGPLPEGICDAFVRFPASFVRKDKFEKILSKNYSIQIQFNEDKRTYLAGKTLIDVYGYFGRLKTNYI